TSWRCNAPYNAAPVAPPISQIPPAIASAFALVSPASDPATAAVGAVDTAADCAARVAPVAAAVAAIDANNAACTRCFASTGASPPVPNARNASSGFILHLAARAAASRLARTLGAPSAAANTPY